jgi:hypothetical protein
MSYSVLSDYKNTVYAQSNDSKLSVEIRPIRVTRTELVEVSAFQKKRTGMTQMLRMNADKKCKEQR